MTPAPRTEQPAPIAATTPTLQVLSIIPSLVPGGGAEQSLVAMAPLLADHGIRITVATLHPGGALERELVTRGVPVHPVRAGTVPGRARELRGLIRSMRPDLVHTSLFDADLAGRLAAFGTGVPVVTTWASTAYAKERRLEGGTAPWKRAVVQRVDAVTGRWSNCRFHAVTAGVARACCRDLGVPADRVRVVERGRDLTRFRYPPTAANRAEARRRLGVDDATTLLLSVGRLRHQKGYNVLLEAWERLAISRPEAELAIIGPDGPASEDVHRALADLRGRHPEVARRVRLFGERRDVPELLAAADLFVMSSITEGAAGALLEALATGIPAVATRVAGLEGVVDERHVVGAIPANVDSLAEAITKALDDPEEAHRRARAGRRLVEERFTVERAAEGMAEMFRWACGDRVLR